MDEPSDDPLELQPLCFLVGPTAAGKSALALELAERAGAEIVSLDSMQVYRGMDVGTAKPGAAERVRVRHHVLDRVDPPERYDVLAFVADVRAALADIHARGVRALIAGGTGFYLKALTHGVFSGPPTDLALRAELGAWARAVGPAAAHAELAAVDPSAAGRIHQNDARRVLRGLEVWRQTGRALSDWQREWRARDGRARRIVGLACDGDELARRIEQRTRAMLAAGWADEARAIRDGCGFGPTSSQALGYTEALELADGSLALEPAVLRIALRTRQFAKRQRTWFQSFPEIRWLEAVDRPAELGALARRAQDELGWSSGS